MTSTPQPPTLVQAVAHSRRSHPAALPRTGGPRMTDPDGAEVASASRPSGDGLQDVECQQYRRRAPELALGVMCGRERAAMLSHLQRCGRCQDRVSGFAVTAMRLVELVPEMEPPAGFEQRVLAAIATAPAPVPLGTPSERLATGSVPAFPDAVTSDPDGPTQTVAEPRLMRVETSVRTQESTSSGRWGVRRQLAAGAVLAGACAVLMTGGGLATSGPAPSPCLTTTTQIGNGNALAWSEQPAQRLSIGRPGQRHHYQRLLDGWYYLLDQQRPDDRQLPFGRSAAK